MLGNVYRPSSTPSLTVEESAHNREKLLHYGADPSLYFNDIYPLKNRLSILAQVTVEERQITISLLFLRGCAFTVYLTKVHYANLLAVSLNTYFIPSCFETCFAHTIEVLGHEPTFTTILCSARFSKPQTLVLLERMKLHKILSCLLELLIYSSVILL